MLCHIFYFLNLSRHNIIALTGVNSKILCCFAFLTLFKLSSTVLYSVATKEWISV